MAFQRPEPLPFAQNLSLTVGHLYCRHFRGRDKFDEYTNPLGRPLLLGHVIPDFQRDLVWTTEQKRNLIHSLWMEIPIGTYSINYAEGLPPEFYNIILDGQQRMSALQDYWEDKFEYGGCVWSEVPKIDRGLFEHRHFPQMRTRIRDKSDIYRYYNAMNFGGTAHKDTDYLDTNAG